VWAAWPARKIASVGVHLRRHVASHGVALNVTAAPLPWFARIVACGLEGVAATSIESEQAWQREQGQEQQQQQQPPPPPPPPLPPLPPLPELELDRPEHGQRPEREWEERQQKCMREGVEEPLNHGFGLGLGLGLGLDEPGSGFGPGSGRGQGGAKQSAVPTVSEVADTFVQEFARLWGGIDEIYRIESL
jgi:type IV secretory pathway VirB10-like protein